MTEIEKLIWRLESLKKSKSKSITLGIDYLLGLLNSVPASKVSVKQQTPQTQQVNVDGGTFRDS